MAALFGKEAAANLAKASTSTPVLPAVPSVTYAAPAPSWGQYPAQPAPSSATSQPARPRIQYARDAAGNRQCHICLKKGITAFHEHTECLKKRLSEIQPQSQAHPAASGMGQ